MLALRRSLCSVIKNKETLSRIQKKHTLPKLPYEYNALEPIICGEILEVHHSKHHAAYVNALNDVEEKMKAAASKGDYLAMINLGGALKFHGGGHLNHSLYWENLSPCGGEPSKELMCAITNEFGSLDNMKDQLSQLAIGVQGSGWAWLGYNKKSCRVEIEKCGNQDPLETTTGLIPLLALDVWEHAYYLQYKNARAEYVKNFWQIINWKTVSERYANASKS